MDAGSPSSRSRAGFRLRQGYDGQGGVTPASSEERHPRLGLGPRLLTAVAVGVAAAPGSVSQKRSPLPGAAPGRSQTCDAYRGRAADQRQIHRRAAVHEHERGEGQAPSSPDGIQEDILTNLALLPELHVVSRTSVMQYRNTTKTIRQIAQELGVTYVLEGSVRRSGNKVRVTGQLIHAASDEHVWAASYDRDLHRRLHDPSRAVTADRREA